MNHLVKHTLAAACLVAAAGQALATSSSSATMGNLLITLTDLNPTDGIAPSLTFTSEGRASLLSAVNSWGDIIDGKVAIRYAPNPQGPLSADTHTDWASSSASVMAANTAAGFTTMSTHGVAGSGPDAYGYYRGNATNAMPQNDFTLSANTAVTFSVIASTQSSTSMGYNLEADQGEYATAHALMNVYGSVNGQFQIDTQEHISYSDFSVRGDGSTMGASDSWSGKLAVSFYNYGATSTTGQLQSFVDVEGQSAVWDGVTPVPEPETYAMMLGGLALIGAVGRRRSRRAKGAVVQLDVNEKGRPQ